MSLCLKVSDITKGYSGRRVLRGCSFTLAGGGVHALMGPNGCGKSTLLRVCALIEEPDSGRIEYSSNGKTRKTDVELRRRVTLVLPSVGVFNTTVFGNVAYGLKIRGVRHREIEERAAEALDFVGLLGKRQQDGRTLSSGETQRLGIARALVIEPEVLFLDEPTASVDQENTEIIEGLILRLKGQRQSTIVLSTHDREQAARLADSILFMENGVIRPAAMSSQS